MPTIQELEAIKHPGNIRKIPNYKRDMAKTWCKCPVFTCLRATNGSFGQMEFGPQAFSSDKSGPSWFQRAWARARNGSHSRKQGRKRFLSSVKNKSANGKRGLKQIVTKVENTRSLTLPVQGRLFFFFLHSEKILSAFFCNYWWILQNPNKQKSKNRN